MQEDDGTGLTMVPSRYARPAPPPAVPPKPAAKPWDDPARDPIAELRALQSDLSPSVLANLEFLRWMHENRPERMK